MSMLNGAKILLVDDEIDFTNTLADILTARNYRIEATNDGEGALRLLGAQHFDLVILDLLMPAAPKPPIRALDGLDTLRRIKARHNGLPVIVLSANHQPEKIVEAIRLGAFDYLVKPLDCDRLQTLVKNAVAAQNAMLAVKSFRRRRPGSIILQGNDAGQAHDFPGFENVIGVNEKMREVFKALGRAVDSTVAISLRGEAGTGKELMAQAIHAAGSRRDRPFVIVNCDNLPYTGALQNAGSGVLPAKALHAELFGDMIDASIGASVRRPGAFEEAQGGTLFLDEVGDLPPEIQFKLLRVLQENGLAPASTGSAGPVPADVRIIAASKKNLEVEMESGRFRQDLYYRLSVCSVFLPPLRERRDDIPALAAHFVEKFNKRYARRVEKISSTALELLMGYEWPGNVQELESAVERGVLNAAGSVLLPEHVPPNLKTASDEAFPLRETNDVKTAVLRSRDITPLREIEKAVLRQALKITNYNMSSAASGLGIGRTTLYRKLQKYQIPLPR
jgi:DNA-binding NtrC family response regulator